MSVAVLVQLAERDMRRFSLVFYLYVPRAIS